MAHHTKKDFAKICGFATNQLSVLIKRGEKGGIILNDQDMVDDGHEVNRRFIERRRDKGKMPSGQEIAVPATISEPKAHKKAGDKDGKSSDLGKNTTFAEAVRIERVEKTLKMRRDREHREIQIAKLNGELVPTDLVIPLVTENSDSIWGAVLEAFENLLIIISQQKELTGDEMATISARVLPIINKAKDNSIAVTKRKLSQIVKEYSLKKSVGEHG